MKVTIVDKQQMCRNGYNGEILVALLANKKGAEAPLQGEEVGRRYKV